MNRKGGMEGFLVIKEVFLALVWKCVMVAVSCNLKILMIHVQVSHEV
jgi:hypothetical protein